MKREEVEKFNVHPGIKLEITQTPVGDGGDLFNVNVKALNIPGVKKAALLSALFNAALNQWCEICGATGTEEVYGGENLENLQKIKSTTFGNQEIMEAMKKDSN